MQNIIQVKELKKKFPIKDSFVKAVEGVNLSVHKGEIFGFLGPNGAGKTTTLRMLTTLLPIDSGEAFISGYSVKTQPNMVRKKIGFVSQQGGADRKSTGYENLLLQANLHGLNKNQITHSVENLINTFSLKDCIHRFVSTYSGGQQRRLDLALSMIHNPEVLFLDEPTTGLDPQSRANLWKKIKTLNKNGMTVFITSHYLDEIDFLADRLAIMDKGKIVALGSLNELKKQIAGDVINLSLNKEVLLKALDLLKQQSYVKEINQLSSTNLNLYVEDGNSSLAKILRLLDKENFVLESINLSVPTLDDVFLKKTGHSLRE